MKIQQVITFITDCGTENPTSYDADLLKQLHDHFFKKHPDSELVAEDIKLIVTIYRNRWKIKSDRNFMLYPAGINQKWVAFAKQLTNDLALPGAESLAEEFTKEITKGVPKELPKDIAKRYIYLLVPVAANEVDYNDGTLIADTENLENLYLGLDGVTLYRKRSLLMLQRNDDKFGTRRSKKDDSIYALSVEELAQMKICQPISPKITIEGDSQYENLWDYFQKCCFNKLQQNYSQIPTALLPLFVDMLLLIESYFALKAKQGNFQEVKDAFNKLTSKLYKIKKFEKINYFYGIKINNQDNNEILLDILIDILLADAYTLDNQLIAIARFLYQFKPALKCNSPDLAYLYENLHASLGTNSNSTHSNSSNAAYSPEGYDISGGSNKSSSSSSSSSSRNSNRFYQPLASSAEKINLDHPIWKIFVSSYCFDFTMHTFDFSKIAFWNEVKDVPPFIKEIYSEINELLAQKMYTKVEEKYDIIEKIIKRELDALKAPQTHSFTSVVLATVERSGLLVTNPGQTLLWLEKAFIRALDELHFHPCEPELMLEALNGLDWGNSVTNHKTKVFLDDLLHTYAEINVNENDKILKANNLYARFFRSLDDDNKRYLHTLIKIHDLSHAKVNFNQNCINYLMVRLGEKGFVPPTEYAFFYQCMDIMDKLSSPQVKSKRSLYDIIDLFKTKVSAHSKTFEDKTISGMTAYLEFLTEHMPFPEEKLTHGTSVNAGNTTYVGDFS